MARAHPGRAQDLVRGLQIGHLTDRLAARTTTSPQIVRPTVTQGSNLLDFRPVLSKLPGPNWSDRFGLIKVV